VRQLDVVLADGGQDGAAGFCGELFGGEHAGEVGGEKLHKLGGDVSGGVGYGCVVATLPADLIERGEEGVRADEEVLVFFGAALEAPNQNGGSEACVVQNAAANQQGDFAGRGRVGKFACREAAGFGEFALVVPAAEAIELVAADFDVHIIHGDEVGKGGDFILRGEDNVDGADRIREAEFFKFREAFGQRELLVAINARIGDGLVERDGGRPLRDGVFAFTALVEPDLDAMDFVEKVGGALDEQIGETGSRAGVDKRTATLGFESVVIAELFDFEGMAGEVRTEVEIARAEAQRSAQNDFVKDGSGSVDDELAAASGADDAEEVAGVDFGNRNRGLFAEKATPARGVAITAPDVMTLAFEQLGQEGAGRTRSENEDSHVCE